PPGADRRRRLPVCDGGGRRGCWAAAVGYRQPPTAENRVDRAADPDRRAAAGDCGRRAMVAADGHGAGVDLRAAGRGLSRDDCQGVDLQATAVERAGLRARPAGEACGGGRGRLQCGRAAYDSCVLLLPAPARTVGRSRTSAAGRSAQATLRAWTGNTGDHGTTGLRAVDAEAGVYGDAASGG